VEDLARLLRELRRRDARQRRDAPLTFRQLASRTGWSFTVISQYFAGKVLPPTDRFDGLVRLLGATPAEQRALATARDRVEELRREARGEASGGAVVSGVVPQALPAPVPSFTGRQAELRALSSALGGGDGTRGAVLVFVIIGTAGVGKTTLAVHWAHQVAAHFPDGQLYVNLRGFDPAGQTMAPAEAVRCLLDALRVPAQRVPPSLDGQHALYRSLLADKRMLVVLDNARDTGQVRPLLPGSSGCVVLVTSRNQLTGLVAADGAHPVVLDLLSPAEAREFLTRRLGTTRVAAEPVAAEEIATRCARLPLALAIAAARAVVQPRLTLRCLASEVRDTQHRWAVLTADDDATDVRTVFSWSYDALSPPAARLFRLLGLHPGPDLTEAAAASLAGLTPTEVRPSLAELARAYLTVEHVPGRYALHDLLRDYAAELARTTDPADQRQRAVRRMLDHYLHSAFAGDRLLSAHRDPIGLGPPASGCRPEAPADLGRALDWFSAEHAVLLAVLDLAVTGWDTYTWQLAWSLATYLERQGHWQEWVGSGYVAVAAAERTGDRSAQAAARRLVARASLEAGRIDEAHAELRRAAQLFEESGDLVQQAHTHLLISDVCERRGHLADALDNARRALDLYRAGGHLRGHADALNTVGWYHACLGEHQHAITYCEQALALHQRLGPGIVLATTWDSLGYAHHHLGHHSRSVTCYQHAVDMFRELGDRHREAESLTRLGEVHRDAGDLVATADAWHRALTILDDLEHPDADDLRARLGQLSPRA
jgi:tetratricopeptide (TPR) repeat protein